MLPDSTQSEAAPLASSSAANPPSASRDGPSGSNTRGNHSDKSKKKRKHKSQERSAKSSKKKKLSKESTHKEQNPSKKSKKDSAESKKPDPEEQDSDLDMENELKPIRDYVKDREDMLQHMFKCLIKANKLRAMLPDILKEIKVDELQQLCLLQLEGMSKSRIMSVLAGEDMQSSSDDDESDSDLERAHSKPDDNVGDDNLINSEVVDSTSSLPQASESVGDVEEAVDVQEAEKEAAGEETNIADSDVEDDQEADEDDATLDDGWHDDSGRQQGFSDRDSEDEVSDSRHRDQESDNTDSSAVDDRDELQEEEEEVKVERAKKFRRIKIVRAEGEECEEGEITSDEVETDEDSISSSKKNAEGEPSMEDDTGDVKPQDTHRGEGVAEESRTNSGNQGDDDRDDDFVDNDRNSAHVVIDLNVAKDVTEGNANVPVNVVSDKGVTDDALDAKIPTTVVKDVSGDSLNVFAEDVFEMDAEEPGTRESSQTVADESDVNDSVAEEAASQDNANATNDIDENLKEIADEDDVSASEADDGENIGNENTASVHETPGPTTPGLGASDTVKPSGRKVAQQLEVLELELRARAIRSLMKQYGKDVG